MRTEANLTHGGACGKRKERLYRLWKSMRGRCSNPNLDFAHRYVLRGITVCEEWQDYNEFRSWALTNGYRDDLTLDRIDNDKGYSPDNCRWADWVTQANNTSRNTFVTVGDERLTLAQAERTYGIPARLYRQRRARGWSEERALSEPLKTWSRHKKK